MTVDGPTSPRATAEPGRFILAPTSDGRGLLLDRQSGALYHLNQVATLIWLEALAGRTPATIAGTVAAEFGIAREVAERDVQTALILSPSRRLAEPPGPYRFLRISAGHQLSLGDRPLFSIEAEGRRLSPLIPLSDPHLATHLRNLAPKLLALRGVTVLHASAVLLEGGAVLAFSGPSGSGKTTLARGFAAKGAAALLAEDKIALAVGERDVHALTGTEARIEAWVTGTIETLRRHPGGGAVDLGDLGAEGWREPRAALREIWLLSQSRRSGDELRLASEGLEPMLAELLPQLFFATDDEASWRLRLTELGRMSRSVRLRVVTAPEGVDRLEGAIDAYSSSSTS